MGLLQRLTGRVSNAIQQDDPVRYVQWVVTETPAGVSVTNDTALQLSVVWACILAITNAIASCPWNIFSQTHKKRELRPDDPLYYLLNTRPNPDMTAISLREALLFQVLSWGNAYAEIVRDMSGRIVEMWPLLSHRMVPRRDESGALFYEYFQMDGAKVNLDPRDIFHLKGPGITGLMGDNVVARGARSMALAAAQERFASTYFGNNTVLGGYLEYPGKLPKEAYDRLRTDWEDRFKGPDKSNRPAILEGGMKWTPLQTNASGAQLVESRKFQIEEICRWYGVPPHKVQHMERATFNNIEHLGIEFVRDALTPWAIRLEQEADFKLFPGRRPRFSKLDMTWLTHGDAKSRAEASQIHRRMGTLTANEIREGEGRNPLGPEGDVAIVEMNMIPLDRMLLAPGAPGAPGTPGSGGSATTGDGSAPADETSGNDPQTDGSAGGSNDPMRAEGKRKISAQELVRESAVMLFASVFDRYGRRMGNREADLRRGKASAHKLETHLADEREKCRPWIVEECGPALSLVARAYETAEDAAAAVLVAADQIDNGETPRGAAEKLVELLSAPRAKEKAA